jgi:predicted RNase H-like nuclease (RuvC/YqgF family)
MMGLVIWAMGAYAQDSAKASHEMNIQMSRYEQIIGRMQQQNQQMQSDIRALQRANDALSRKINDTDQHAQSVGDDFQRFRNVQARNGDVKVWGEGQRDCPELRVKHQQIKVTMSPDGTKSVRFLCFDGKPLLLGSEQYTVDGQ